VNILTKIDRFLRDILLFIYDLLRFIPYQIAFPAVSSMAFVNFPKEIFLIKTDEIGDYILFRNFLPFIKQNKKFKDYKIVLCGNSAWRDIANFFDVDYIDEFIWIEKKNFMNDLFYRYKFLKMLSSRKSALTINCSYSRSFFIDDAIIRSIPSERKIGFKSDLSNSYNWQLKISNKYYDELINSEEVVFEFYKNKILFEKIFCLNINLKQPNINCENLKSEFKINDNYVAFFIGGRYAYKRWDIGNFVKLGKYIIQNYGLKILLLGAISEAKLNSSFINKIEMQEQVIDLTGKTSLKDIIKILEHSKILVSNDTGIVHIAASVGTSAVVIANGTHYGRFFPYPDDTNKKMALIFPPEISTLIEKESFLQEKLKYRSLYDLNHVNYNLVKEKVDSFLHNLK
jgi:ADP-heptose:LPS heptosyltransferase